MRIRVATPKYDETDGKAILTRCVQVTDLDTGGDMRDAIRSLTVLIGPDDVVRAEAQLYVSEVEIDAVLSYVLQPPGSRDEPKAVKRIEFHDGTVWPTPFEPGLIDATVLKRALQVIEMYQVEIRERDDLKGFCQGSWFKETALELAENYKEATGKDFFVRTMVKRFGND